MLLQVLFNGGAGSGRDQDGSEISADKLKGIDDAGNDRLVDNALRIGGKEIKTGVGKRL